MNCRTIAFAAIVALTLFQMGHGLELIGGGVLREKSCHVSCHSFKSIGVFDLAQLQLNVNFFPAEGSSATKLHVAKMDNVEKHPIFFFTDVEEPQLLYKV